MKCLRRGLRNEAMDLVVEVGARAECHPRHSEVSYLVWHIVNDFINKAKEFDGFIFGTPVYYAHPSGRLLSLLDRAFYAGGYAFQYKPGAAIASARRSGTTASFDVLNKYFTIANMPIVSSNYWNNIHGKIAEDAREDLEGLQTMRNLARNMAWILKCIEIGKRSGIEIPKQEERIYTNFIR